MKIGIFGTGAVGNTIGSKLVELGHSVMMGLRTANNEKRRHLAMVINCTIGTGSLNALTLARGKNWKPLFFTKLLKAMINSF